MPKISTGVVILNLTGQGCGGSDEFIEGRLNLDVEYIPYQYGIMKPIGPHDSRRRISHEQDFE